MNSGTLRVKLFQDGANLDQMIAARNRGLVSGFTTNPTLMRKAGLNDYKAFALKAIAAIPDLPISFEVIADDFDTMEREAREIASWGGDTYVKIPITNTKGESAAPLVRKLSGEGFSLNVTAILALDQVAQIASVADRAARTIVSVFAGRVADTGVDPVPMMTKAVSILKPLPKAELLWASPREVLNVVQAESCGCHIITATPDIVAKVPLLGKDLHQYSLETVKMFHDSDGARSSLDVRVMQLDDLKELRTGRVDFIKVDTQGCEARVLDGALSTILRNADHLRMVLEFWPFGLEAAGNNVEALLSRLADLPFEVALLDEDARSLRWVDLEQLSALAAGPLHPRTKAHANLFLQPRSVRREAGR